MRCWLRTEAESATCGDTFTTSPSPLVARARTLALKHALGCLGNFGQPAALGVSLSGIGPFPGATVACLTACCSQYIA
jgi:hypothetical protein